MPLLRGHMNRVHILPRSDLGGLKVAEPNNKLEELLVIALRRQVQRRLSLLRRRLYQRCHSLLPSGAVDDAEDGRHVAGSHGVKERPVHPQSEIHRRLGFRLLISPSRLNALALSF